MAAVVDAARQREVVDPAAEMQEPAHNQSIDNQSTLTRVRLCGGNGIGGSVAILVSV